MVEPTTATISSATIASSRLTSTWPWSAASTCSGPPNPTGLRSHSRQRPSAPGVTHRETRPVSVVAPNPCAQRSAPSAAIRRAKPLRLVLVAPPWSCGSEVAPTRITPPSSIGRSAARWSNSLPESADTNVGPGSITSGRDASRPGAANPTRLPASTRHSTSTGSRVSPYHATGASSTHTPNAVWTCRAPPSSSVTAHASS